MQVWTPTDRNEFVQYAINTEDDYGHRGPYNFRHLPKMTGIETEDIKRSLVTETLAHTIYEKNPMYRKISLGFYETLIHKLASNPYTGPHLGNNLIVLINGSNAYPFVSGNISPEVFQFSDLDIVVNINPLLDDEMWNVLERTTKVCVLQTMSQYKRLLDSMFFVNKNVDGMFMDEQLIEEFKRDYNEMLKEIVITSEPNETGNINTCSFVSPFESDEVRNYCSKNSCMLTHSLVKEDTVVRVEVPHFDQCERIPLRRTPIFCSYNETIDFSRTDDSTMSGQFDLYRIRLNNKYVEKNENGDIVNEGRIVADFIDISIAKKNDIKLIDFWSRGRCISVYDRYSNIWLMVPNITSCIDDLYKMLNVYNCPESKKEKRQQKYNKMCELCNINYGLY